MLAAGIAYGAWLVFQASGESLPNVSSMGSRRLEHADDADAA